MQRVKLTDSRSSKAIDPSADEIYQLGRLDKLPAEIRNQIYRLCLTTKEPINVKRVRKGRSNSDSRLRAQCNFERTEYDLICTSLLQVKGKQMRRLPISRAITGCLLRVSKALHHEVAPILYRYNCFEFETPPALSKFFHAIGRHGALVADIRIKKIDWHKQALHLTTLAQVANPRRFRASAASQCLYSTTSEHAADIWRAVRPFVQQTSRSMTPPASSDSAGSASAETQLLRLNTIELDISSAWWLFKQIRVRDRIPTDDEEQWRAKSWGLVLSSFHKSVKDKGELKGSKMRGTTEQ